MISSSISTLELNLKVHILESWALQVLQGKADPQVGIDDRPNPSQNGVEPFCALLNPFVNADLSIPILVLTGSSPPHSLSIPYMVFKVLRRLLLNCEQQCIGEQRWGSKREREEHESTDEWMAIRKGVSRRDERDV